MANGIYYVEDNNGTPFARITAAINAAHADGGGKVVLSNITYCISQSLTLYSNITFSGVGPSSVIHCTADVPIIQIDRSSSSYIQISDMLLRYSTDMNTTTHFHVEADRPLNLKIIGVTFNGEGRNNSGVLTWDALSGDKEQPILIDDNHPDQAYMTHIENCLFGGASIWLNDSDSRIVNNYIWANSPTTNNLDFAIRLSNGAVNISGNDIVPGNRAGVYLAPTCKGIRIENNYFDGSWDNVYTGWGTYVDRSTQILILGNVFMKLYQGGAYVVQAYQVNVSNNSFIEINRSGSSLTCYDVWVVSGPILSTGHIIEGNLHMRSLTAGQNFAVCVNGNAQASVINNSLLDWRENGTDAYVKPPFYMWPDKYTIRRDNRVTNRVTGTYPYQFDEGEVTVPHNNSTQTISVSFAQDFSAQNIVPKVQDIHINFVAALSNSSVVYSIWGVSNTGFNISVRPVDSSSSSSGVFCWRVSLQ